MGKTALIKTYVDGKFPSGFICPTVFDNYTATLTVDHELVNLGLWDTAGPEDYDRLRPLSYPETDVFLLCFSLTEPDSWSNVRYKWWKEVTSHCPKIPKILVGTQLDLRGNSDTVTQLARQRKTPVSTEQGEKLKKQIGAEGYVECSALRGEGVNQVFEEAVKVVLDLRRAKKLEAQRKDKNFYEK